MCQTVKKIANILDIALLQCETVKLDSSLLVYYPWHDCSFESNVRTLSVRKLDARAPFMSNRSFPSYPEPLLQNDASCKTFLKKMTLTENEPVHITHFHMNGFALRLVSTQRQKAT